MDSCIPTVGHGDSAPLHNSWDETLASILFKNKHIVNNLELYYSGFNDKFASTNDSFNQPKWDL